MHLHKEEQKHRTHALSAIDRKIAWLMPKLSKAGTRF